MKKITTLVFIMGLNSGVEGTRYPYGVPPGIESAKYQTITTTSKIEYGSINGDPEVQSQTRTPSRIPKWMCYTTGCLVISAVIVIGVEFYGAIEQRLEGGSNSTHG